jgi:hypothetical protein
MSFIENSAFCASNACPERPRRVPRGESQPESRMPEIGTSGLMSGDGKRGDGQVAAPILDLP